MLRFLFSGFAASCCCELCAALYAKLWLPQRLLQAAACCCLLPVSIHLSSVTLGGTEAACEYLSENVALVSATAAVAATSATLPCPISRLGSWAISVIILSFQLVCKIPATLQCQLQLFSRALIKAWQFYSSSAQQLYSYCATGQLRLSHNLLTLYLIWICRSIDRSWHTEATARTHCSAIMRSYIFMHGTYSMQNET